ncbi:PstS family phosphate ABC transporter substrate-binding protein [Salibacterium aidingense]|uniref:PstS family phosphate ABC transporter substrate-binding protein n=1 Tax=Salibacterium aidingense TaxID=384933 RepID=UPI003BC4EBF5
MEKRIIGMAAFTVAGAAISAFTVLLSMLLFQQSTYIYVGIIAAALLILGNVLISGAFQRLSTTMKIVLPLLLFVLPLAGYGGYEAYIDHIEIENAEVDLTAYEPFRKETKAVRLEQPSSFTLKENLPELDGATALYPVYSAFVRAVYPENEYPHDNTLDREVAVSKTPGAYNRLAAQNVDMIFAAGPSEKQESKLRPEMEQTAIGKEAFVFFVHDSNPVQSLTVEELRGIYSGDITNWEEVGGKNQEIIAFQRPEGSGSQTGLQKMMDGKKIMDPPSDHRVTGMGGVIEKASSYRNHRNAIGFSYRYFSTQMKENNNIKLLKVNDVPPDVPSIKNDEYPLSSEFYAITNGTDNPNVPPFIDWILSEEGQTIIEKTGYVPLGEN